MTTLRGCVCVRSWYLTFVCLIWGKSWTNTPSLALLCTHTLAKQKTGRITQNETFQSYLSALQQTFRPTCSLVFLSAAWIRWSISSSISLSCIWAWSCALQNKNRIVSPSIISDGIWNCRGSLKRVAGFFLPSFLSGSASVSDFNFSFFSLFLLRPSHTTQRHIFSCQYFALKRVFLSILT